MSKLLVEMITTRIIEESELEKYCQRMLANGLRPTLVRDFKEQGSAVLETPAEQARTVYRWTRMAD